jgi:hypothetical protein
MTNCRSGFKPGLKGKKKPDNMSSASGIAVPETPSKKPIYFGMDVPTNGRDDILKCARGVSPAEGGVS